MSLLEEYKDQEAARQKDAKASVDHYNSVDLPGTRVMSTDTDVSSARERIEEMKKLR